MQSIIYNNVPLEIIRTNYVAREAIHTDDKATYLYTRWVIDVVAHIVTVETPGNPAANVYPGMTDNEIRNLLMQPRRQLKVVAGGDEILFSPQRIPGGGNDVYPCDAKNGPFCTVFGIRQMIGVNMFVIHCKFETHVVEYEERQESGKLPNVVLSNRWSMAEDIDELHYPTRVVVGEAILRTDLMRQRDFGARDGSGPGIGRPNFNADSLRSSFFFPVPDNYQRQNVKVELSTDGSRLRWSFEDVGKCYNLGQTSPILKVEAWRNAQIEGSAPLRPLSAGGWMITRDALNLRMPQVGTALEMVRDAMPRYRIQAHVELWGDRDAPQGLLFALALGCAMNQVGFNLSALTVGTAQMVSTQALHEKHVTVDLIVWWGEDANFGLAFIAPLIPLTIANVNSGLRSLVNALVRDDRKITAVDIGQGQTFIHDQTPGGVKQNPPFSPGNRGNLSLIVNLVSQILEEPNQAPLRPAIPMALV